MLIRHIMLENIRGLGYDAPLHLALEPMDGTLAGWHVVVGPNGSGKSTLLRAVALACAGPGVIKALQPSRGWWLGDSKSPAKIAVVLDKGADDAWYTPHPDSGGDFEGVGQLGTARLEVRLSTTQMTGTGGPENPASGPWIDNDQPPGWFIAGYGATRHIADGNRFPGDGGISESRPVAQLSSLFAANGAIADPVSWLKQLKLQKEPLLPRLLELVSDGLLPRSGKAVGVESDGLLLHEDGRTLPLTSLSDGYQTVVALVLDLVRQLARTHGGIRTSRHDGRAIIENEGVVLIDEIEAHLHPGWQRRIGAWLVAHFPNMQFIVTTHSPFICQAATSGCVVRLAHPDEGRPSRVLTRAELEPVVNGTADDIYVSALFGIDSTRSPAGEALLARASELEAKILDRVATDEERAEYRRVKARVPPSADVLQALDAARLRAG